MGKIYNISIGQLITLWVFGIVGIFFALIGFLATESALYVFLVVCIPFFLIFYTIGWKNRKKE